MTRHDFAECLMAGTLNTWTRFFYADDDGRDGGDNGDDDGRHLGGAD